MSQNRQMNVLAALAGSLMLVMGWLFLPSPGEMFGSAAYQYAWTLFVFGSSAWMLVDALQPVKFSVKSAGRHE